MGWRPGMPPIGYYNRLGVKDIVVDPDRGHIVTQMFQRVVESGDSGRTLMKWLDTCLTSWLPSLDSLFSHNIHVEIYHVTPLKGQVVPLDLSDLF